MADGLMQTLNVTLPRKLDLPAGAGSVNLRAVDQMAGTVVTRSTDIALNTGVALALLVAGWLVSRWLAGQTQQLLIRARVDETFAAFLGSVARYVFFLACAVGALNLVGMSGTSIVALFGAIGLAVAFALRNTLSHVAAGVMLVVNQPFRVGDFIEVNKQMGTVKRITLFNTEINTVQNLRVFIPNSIIWENVAINHTYNAQRIVEMTIRGSYRDTGVAVLEVLNEAIAAEELILDTPEPFVGTDKLGDYGIDYLVRVWVRTGDYGKVRHSLPETLRQAMEQAGLELPLPQQVVQYVQTVRAGVPMLPPAFEAEQIQHG